MLTEHEARQLQREMHRELDAAPGAVWKCVAGLLIVVAVAMSGSGVGFPDAAPAQISSNLSR